MYSKQRKRQFVRFKINGLIAFVVMAILIASLIGAVIMIWYQVTDPERLEPSRACLMDAVSLHNGAFSFSSSCPGDISLAD